MSLLELNTTRKQRVSKKVPELDASNKDSKKYKMEAIWNSAVYANKLESSHLSGLYYLVAWKGYSKEENTWELLSAVQHLKKLINSFYKKHSKKLTATSQLIHSAPMRARPMVKPIRHIKQKQGRPINSAASKQAKKNWARDLLLLRYYKRRWFS